MAKDKKSFVLYADLIHTVKKLPKEDAGELFMHILEYVNDLNPDTENPLVDIAFEPIKRQFKRDLKKWEGIKDKRSEAGKKGANKRWQNKANAKKDVAKQAPVKHWNEDIGVDGHIKK